MKTWHEELRQATGEMPPNYNVVIEARVVSQIKNLIFRQKTVHLAQSIDGLMAKAKFVRAELMKSEASLKDKDCIDLYNEAVKKVKTGADFFATP